MFPDAEAQRIAIDTDGFLYLADSAVGLRAEEFAKNGWPRTNLEGLRFLKKHTVDDEVRIFAHFWAPSNIIYSVLLIYFTPPSLVQKSEATCICHLTQPVYPASLHQK